MIKYKNLERNIKKGIIIYLLFFIFYLFYKLIYL